MNLDAHVIPFHFKVDTNREQGAVRCEQGEERIRNHHLYHVFREMVSGVPLKVIQKISGHKTLGALQKYLDVLDSDLESAVSTLTF